MKRKFTTPASLQGRIGKPEHNCFPMHVGGKLIATCNQHYGQQPALRNGNR